MSIAWRQTMCPMTAPWHPYDQAVYPHSRARIFQPTAMKGEVRGGVLRFVILGMMVGVQLDRIAVIVTFAPSVDPVHAHKAMHCTAYPSTRQPLKPGNQKE